MDGFLVIDKPADWTSHDVVARVRRLAKQKRVGHTGTLDPDATGILVVCLGFATRLIEYTDGYRKRYRADLALGVETDSQDASGNVVAEQDASGVTEEALRAVLPRFTGDILQVPPMVSAIHHQGERLYDLARRGEVVERAARSVTIYRLDASDLRAGTVARATLEIECSTGTYVRTLCHDIGEALGVGGHMASLRRTAVGPFTGSDAVSLEDLAETAGQGRLADLVRPVGDLLPEDWARVEGAEDDVTEITHGRPIPAEGPGEHGIFFGNGRLMAVLRRDGDLWRPIKGIPKA